MAITLIASNTKAGATSDPINTTGADFIVVAASSETPTSATDSKGNTYTPQKIWGSIPHTRLFTITNPIVGTNHTFTINGSYPAIAVYAFSGLGASPQLVGQTGISGTGVTAQSPLGHTSSIGGRLFLASLSKDTSTVPSINSSFNMIQTPLVASVNYSVGLAYLEQVSAGLLNPTWSWSGSANWSTSLAIINPTLVTNSNYSDLVNDAASLIHYWRLDEISGTTATNIKNNTNNGVYQGIYALAGQPPNYINGKSVGLNAGYVTITHHANLQVSAPFSVECWIKTIDTTSTGYIVSKMSTVSQGWGLVLSNGGVGFNVGDGSWLYSPTLINDDNWHHIVGTLSGTTSKIYVDGVLKNTGTRAPDLINTVDMRIGTSSITHNTANFIGSIDEVALYSSALSDQSILDHYNAALNSVAPVSYASGIFNPTIFGHRNILMNPILGETIYLDLPPLHNPTTGAVSDDDATPICKVYENATDTPILTPTVVSRGATGEYRVSIALTVANGFEINKTYNVIVTATVATITAKAKIASFVLRIR